MRMHHSVLFVMGTVVLGLGHTPLYADQSVYIDQVAGDNLTLTINQNSGDGNSIGDPTAVGDSQYFAIDGDSQTITVDQIGSSNTLTGSILYTDTFEFDLSQTGSTNTFAIEQEGGSNGSIVADFVGSNNDVIIDAGLVTSSEYMNLDLDVTGDYNVFDWTIDADGVLNNVTVAGDYNDFEIDQNGYGSSIDFHEVIMNMVGDNNVVDIIQETTLNASHIDLDLSGDNQVITITQSD